jgi:hypothetical protein
LTEELALVIGNEEARGFRALAGSSWCVDPLGLSCWVVAGCVVGWWAGLLDKLATVGCDLVGAVLHKRHSS